MTHRDLAWRPDVVDELRRVDGLEVEVDVLLAKRTTFGIGGPADVLVRAHTEACCRRLWSGAAGRGVLPQGVFYPDPCGC